MSKIQNEIIDTEAEGTVNRAKLESAILALSEATTFDEAKREWMWVGMSYKADVCPCGQHIMNRCHLKNTKNDNEILVGNVCVNNFLDIETGTAFDGFKRLQEDVRSNANADLIKFAEDNNVISAREYSFLDQMKRKRKFSEKQLAWKISINQKILNSITAAGLL